MDLTISALPLLLINAFVVALTAMGACENTFAKREGGAAHESRQPGNHTHDTPAPLLAEMLIVRPFS